MSSNPRKTSEESRWAVNRKDQEDCLGEWLNEERPRRYQRTVRVRHVRGLIGTRDGGSISSLIVYLSSNFPHRLNLNSGKSSMLPSEMVIVGLLISLSWPDIVLLTLVSSICSDSTSSTSSLLRLSFHSFFAVNLCICVPRHSWWSTCLTVSVVSVYALSGVGVSSSLVSSLSLSAQF